MWLEFTDQVIEKNFKGLVSRVDDLFIDQAMSENVEPSSGSFFRR